MNCRHRLQYVINALYDLRELRTVCRSSDITPLSWPFQQLHPDYLAVLVTEPDYLAVPTTAPPLPVRSSNCTQELTWQI